MNDDIAGACRGHHGGQARQTTPLEIYEGPCPIFPPQPLPRSFDYLLLIGTHRLCTESHIALGPVASV